MLEVIYVTRHGFRLSYSVDPATGIYASGIPTPTGIPADVTLTAHGVEQARELAGHLVTVQPQIDLVYSSPYYRCLQTVQPYMQQRKDLQVRAETGLSEWYGTAHFDQPEPAPTSQLQELFPGLLDAAYMPVLAGPSRTGETMAQLHDRVATAAGRLIDRCDADGARAVLLCTHAAAIIALGRVLTGRMPENPETEDFGAFTCGLSVFRRREGWNPETREPDLDEPRGTWRDGRGVRGGWDVERNSDCSFLSGGQERGWRFSGEESFLQTSAPANGGDTGLGVVVQGNSPNRKRDPRL